MGDIQVGVQFLSAQPAPHGKMGSIDFRSGGRYAWLAVQILRDPAVVNGSRDQRSHEHPSSNP
jgi:hypothetical protein